MADVPIARLRPASDPAAFEFATTAEVTPHVGLIGQDRAVEAIKFGLSIESAGFNIVVVGEAGTGRTTAIREYLEQFSHTRRPPDEWCYVNNFADPYRPRALRLPPGRGRDFRNAMASMVAEAKERVPLSFQSEGYTARRDEIVGGLQRRRDAVFSNMAARARQEGFLLQGNPGGFFLVPLAGDQPMDDASFAKMTEADRSALLERRERVMDELRNVLKGEQGYELTVQQQLGELERTVATLVVDNLVDPLVDRFNAFPRVVSYLGEVKRDMIANIGQFMPRPPVPEPAAPFAQRERENLRKYEVNLLIDCAEESCATVVFEENPTPQNLLGRIEKEAIFGAVTTDFTMIRPGSLHQSNGGYLVVNMDDLLPNALSWQELKRTLRTGEITVQEWSDRFGFIETKTVRPEPIPWAGKVVAIAREPVYRALYAIDPDFSELFKVKAEFDLHIPRTSENEQSIAGLIAGLTQREKLLPFDAAAVARVVDEAVKLAADQNQLSIRFGTITDIVREAAHWARSEGAAVVTKGHVARAIRERIWRSNLVEEHMRESMAKGVILVDTSGAAVGQVNGLTVISLGDTTFGQPARITATIGVGREGILDLQREAELSGPIHSKAVLTLQGFLVDRYSVDAPLTLAARLSFEQSYGMIEGDSATCAEVCALLSRLADVPIKQSLAITGSMDQKGVVQAIGGANEKIEGFYDVCRLRGLTGDQGVVIPASNVQHLMLREDLVETVAAGRFKIMSASTIDEALELLTGVPAGVKGPDGAYPADSINGRVTTRLKELSDRLHASTHRQHTGDDGTAAK